MFLVITQAHPQFPLMLLTAETTSSLWDQLQSLFRFLYTNVCFCTIHALNTAPIKGVIIYYMPTGLKSFKTTCSWNIFLPKFVANFWIHKDNNPHMHNLKNSQTVNIMCTSEHQTTIHSRHLLWTYQPNNVFL